MRAIESAGLITSYSPKQLLYRVHLKGTKLKREFRKKYKVYEVQCSANNRATQNEKHTPLTSSEGTVCPDKQCCRAKEANGRMGAEAAGQA